MITMTDAARDKFLEVLETESRKGQGLRITVQGGGTFSPEFALNFVGAEDAREDDVIVNAGELKIHVDPESAQHLEGATIDFLETETARGFKIDAPKCTPPKLEGPLADKIKGLLEERINPSLAGHGGNITLVAIEDDVAYLRFMGGCQGCGMADVTLKQGVEKVLLAEVPELKGVKDVTDHAAGADPYQR